MLREAMEPSNFVLESPRVAESFCINHKNNLFLILNMMKYVLKKIIEVIK